jgi:hypothetical protein
MCACEQNLEWGLPAVTGDRPGLLTPSLPQSRISTRNKTGGVTAWRHRNLEFLIGTNQEIEIAATH